MELEPIDYGDSIQCLECGMISHNPNDIRNLYCGNCKKFLFERSSYYIRWRDRHEPE